MNEEHFIAHLRYSLRKAKRSNFGPINETEKRELTARSKKIPGDLEILKDGSRSLIGGHQLASGRDVVLKYYFPKTFIKKFGNRFRQTPCRRSWIAAHGFAHLKLPTPIVVAIAEHYRFGHINAMSFLATERAPGTQLRELNADRIAQIVPTLKSAFTTMARFKIAHGDLNDSNIIVSPENEIFLIDLDSTRFQLRGKSWIRARERDEERFLRNWIDAPEITGLLKPCFSEATDNVLIGLEDQTTFNNSGSRFDDRASGRDDRQQKDAA